MCMCTDVCVWVCECTSVCMPMCIQGLCVSVSASLEVSCWFVQPLRPHCPTPENGPVRNPSTVHPLQSSSSRGAEANPQAIRHPLCHGPGQDGRQVDTQEGGTPPRADRQQSPTPRWGPQGHASTRTLPTPRAQPLHPPGRTRNCGRAGLPGLSPINLPPHAQIGNQPSLLLTPQPKAQPQCR